VSSAKEWLTAETDQPTRKLIRTEPWLSEHKSEKSDTIIKPEKGEIPEELLDNSRMKHSDRKVVSYIKPELWDNAKWSGTAYIWEATLGAPPLLMFMFENGEVGKQIFKDWRMRLGETDPEEKLRISIIRGISKNEPHNYRVVISANITEGQLFSKKQLVIINRNNLMTPTSSLNLETFIRYYEAAGAYYLAPAELDEVNRRIKPYTRRMIRKKNVSVRWAWEIGMNDPDIMGISPDDDPFIPENEKKPPIAEAMEFLRKLKR